MSRWNIRIPGRRTFRMLVGRMGAFLCEYQWKSLNRIEQKKRNKLIFQIPIWMAAQAFNKKKYKFIDLKNLSYEDRHYLDDMRIDTASLFDSLDLEYGKEKDDQKKLWRNAKNPIAAGCFQTAFQEASCLSGKLVLQCPFSGSEIMSDFSFVVYIKQGFIFYRFCSTEIYYLIIGYPWNGYGKIGFYFPEKELIIGNVPSLGDGRGDAAVNFLKTNMVANAAAVNTYLQSGKKMTAVWTGHHNFAHHFWNDLPAIENAVEKGLFQRVQHLIVTHDTLGPLNHMFPEIPDRMIRRIRQEDLFQLVLSEQLFVIRLGSVFITQSVADRVLKTAKKMCCSAILNKIEQAKKDHYPLLWVSIRNSNRTWIQQEKGLSRIISALFVDYPNIGIVFDGFSIGYAMDIGKETQEMIENLQGVVQRIRKHIPDGIAVYDSVGCGIHESIAWADAVNLYLCHHGTLQHKVGWIANKPGVVHTNCVTHMIENEINHVTFVRENAVSPVYIDASHITDIGEIYSDPRKNLYNYDCDWQVMLKELKILLSNYDA